MKQISYKSLEYSEQISLLNVHGEFVAQRQYYIYNIALYTVFGFFVEAWRFNESNEIAKIEIQECQKELELYLNNIDIKELFS